jgi:CHAD domain-containing protein
MSSATIRAIGVESEAGKLQGDIRDVFSKILSHAKLIDMTMTLGDTTEALGQVRELEMYLERGLEVLSQPMSHQA